MPNQSKPTAKADRARQTAGAEPRVFQLQITLLEVEPRVWRRFQMLSTSTLADLRLAVQIIMGWEDSHLDEFTLGKECYSVPRGVTDMDFDDHASKDARAAVLAEVLPKPGKPFYYTYDFGDTWEHELVVEKILPAQPQARFPVCLEGTGACPPEDCGGPAGYADLLEVLDDPAHENYAGMREWIGEEFDPEKFSVPAVNTELRRHFKTPARKK